MKRGEGAAVKGQLQTRPAAQPASQTKERKREGQRPRALVSQVAAVALTNGRAGRRDVLAIPGLFCAAESGAGGRALGRPSEARGARNALTQLPALAAGTSRTLSVPARRAPPRIRAHLSARANVHALLLLPRDSATLLRMSFPATMRRFRSFRAAASPQLRQVA